MQLKKPFEYLQTYLDNNPDAREIYVNWGLVAAKLAVVPINRLLKHLIEVQHLDVNAVPGARDLTLDSPYLFSSGQMATQAYDDDFDVERLTKIYEKIRSTPPPTPPEDFSRFMDDSVFELDPLDRLQNVLDLLNKELETDESYKPVPNVFREAAENNRDDLSIEEIEKLMARTEELKKIKEDITKNGDAPVVIRNVGKTVKASESPVTLSEAATLTVEMVARGLCSDEPHSTNAQVDEIMKFDREAFEALIFEALKRVVLRKPTIKSADQPKPRRRGKIVKQAAKSPKKKPNKKPDFRGTTLRMPRR